MIWMNPCGGRQILSTLLSEEVEVGFLICAVDLSTRLLGFVELKTEK